MSISELIRKLETMKEQHGDVSVLVYDPSFDTQIEIDEIKYEEKDDNEVEAGTVSIMIEF